jgi:hypothetical protein
MAGVKYKFEFDAFITKSVEEPWETFTSSTAFGKYCVSELPLTAQIITRAVYEAVELDA